MKPDEREEEMLRRLLRDPRWSLSPWPDAGQRVRRTARRQRRGTVTAAAGLSAAAVLAVALPASLTGGRTAAPATPAHPELAYVLSTTSTMTGIRKPILVTAVVTVIDSATGRRVRVIRIPQGPIYPTGGPDVVVAPGGRTVYVTAARGIVPISTAASRPGRVIRLSGGAVTMAVTPDGKVAYVVSRARLYAVSLTTGRIEKAFDIAGASHIVITPDGRTAYVSAGHDVIPIRTATNTELAPVNTGAPVFLTITPDGEVLYAAVDHGLIPVRTTTNTVQRPIRLSGTPRSMVITPDSKTAYVTPFIASLTATASVIPVDIATGRQLRPIPIGPAGLRDPMTITLAPDGQTAYVTAIPKPDAVVPIRLATSSVLPPIEAGPLPGFTAIAPDGRTAYIADAINGSDVVNSRTQGLLTQVDLRSGSARRTIKVTGRPEMVVFAP